jgi:glycerol-1-phosphatase
MRPPGAGRTPASVRPLIERYAAVVCDLDGVVYRGPEAVDHAVAALTGLPVPVVYATNNASRPAREVAAHLTDLGLHVSGRDVVTSSQAGAQELAGRLPNGATVLAVGGPGVGEALRHSGFRVLTPQAARAAPQQEIAGVLQGYGAAVSAADLAEAAYAVSAGAVWVATNTDATLPTHRGTVPGNGALVAAVRLAVDHDPVVVGKPHPPLYRLCAERLDRRPRDVLAVGDRLDTDIAGASAAGMDSALVLTGVDSVTTLAVAPPAIRPSYLVQDLRSLAEDYQPAVAEDGWWTCGRDRRRVVDGCWEVATSGSAMEGARAGVACLHEALDRRELDVESVRRLVAELDQWQ